MDRRYVNSQCSVCSRIFYGKVVDDCPHCHGLCFHVTDHGMELMQRGSSAITEAGIGYSEAGRIPPRCSGHHGHEWGSEGNGG